MKCILITNDWTCGINCKYNLECCYYFDYIDEMDKKIHAPAQNSKAMLTCLPISRLKTPIEYSYDIHPPSYEVVIKKDLNVISKK